MPNTPNFPTTAIDGQHSASSEVLSKTDTPLAVCVVGESANVAENVEVPPVQYYIIPLYILQLFTSPLSHPLAALQVTHALQHLDFPPLYSLPAQALQQVIESSTNSSSFKHCGHRIVVSALIVPLVTFINICCSGVIPVLTWATSAPMANPNSAASARPVRPWDQQPAYLAAINRQLAPGQPAQYGKPSNSHFCHCSRIVLTFAAVPRRQGRTPDDVTDFIAG